MTKLDEVYGIDRYKDSPELGNLVVKEAYIYDKPGGGVVGMIKHGIQVDVKYDRMYKGFSYHKIEGLDVERNTVTGWVRSSLLKYSGEREFK